MSDIIEELLNLPEYDYTSIKNVLDKIYICKMLKSEDRAIENKKKRSLDYREVIVFDYKKAGIELTTFDYISNLKNMINEYEIDLEELGIVEQPVPHNENSENTQSEPIENDEKDYLFEVIHDVPAFVAINIDGAFAHVVKQVKVEIIDLALLQLFLKNLLGIVRFCILMAGIFTRQVVTAAGKLA